MKKVGIITFHRYHNYGAVLQAYATANAIQKFSNYEPEIIDYYQKSELEIWHYVLYKTGYPSNLKRYFLYRFLYRRKITSRFNKFEEFIDKNLKLSPRYSTPEELQNNIPNYDIYMSGSDQIWNYVFAKYSYSCNDVILGSKLMLPYYLNFTDSNNKISYASSMGDCIKYPIPNRCFIKKYKKILVREEKQKKALRKYLNRDDIEQVLDPTLLLDFNDYKNIVITPNISDKYIFAYLFDYNKKEYKNALKLLKLLSKALKLKVIMASNTVPVNSGKIETRIDVSPGEWLGLIKNAELVITNSFHGTAFSINFNTPFFTISKDTRKDTILNMTGLQSRSITDKENINKLLDYKLDFKKANERLEKQRDLSKKLLKDALDSCT